MDKATKVSIEALQRIRDQRKDLIAGGRGKDSAPLQTKREPDRKEWPEPKPLPNGLAPVEPFSSEFIPDALAPWVNDISNRLQCPSDYVAVAALTALGSVTGRRIGIKPQAKTDWIENPNLWGMFIGRPGMLKSPAMGEALKPIHRLESEAAKDNEILQQAYDAGLDAYELRKQVQKALVRERLKAKKTRSTKSSWTSGKNQRSRCRFAIARTMPPMKLSANC